MAALAMGTCKAFGEDAAAQIVCELLIDIVWYRILGIFVPRYVMLFDDLKENSLFRPPRSIHIL